MAKRGRPKKAEIEQEEQEEQTLTLKEVIEQSQATLPIIAGVFTYMGQSTEFNKELNNIQKDRPQKELITLTEFKKQLSQFMNQKN